jgi:hypothetical protein
VSPVDLIDLKRATYVYRQAELALASGTVLCSEHAALHTSTLLLLMLLLHDFTMC